MTKLTYQGQDGFQLEIEGNFSVGHVKRVKLSAGGTSLLDVDGRMLVLLSPPRSPASEILPKVTMTGHLRLPRDPEADL